MAAPQVKAGDVIAGGKYRVEHVLGAGGMGMVVAARHVQLGQRVALKFMLTEALSDPRNAERFAREARAAVQLQSPHTARVLDVGRLQNGEPYMVMEYLEGQDLDAVLQSRGPLPPEVAVGYLLQACEALAEAHGLGMIHRDIKLKNLFLTQTVDGRAIVKVLDFGIVKTASAAGDVSLTSTSAVFGSPQYMSPEQLRSAKDVDSRSDIWSIGVCLYQLLTGQAPFDAEGLMEMCAMVLTDPVQPPSNWTRDLPPELDAVVVKCLAKGTDDRFQSVAELARALEPWTVLEGSARRIAHILETVRRDAPPPVVDPGGETPVASDVGDQTIDVLDTREREVLARARAAELDAPVLPQAVPIAAPAHEPGGWSRWPIVAGAFGAIALAASAALLLGYLRSERAPSPPPHETPATTTPVAVPVIEPVTTPSASPTPTTTVDVAHAPSAAKKPDVRARPPAPSGRPTPAPRPSATSDLANDPHG